MNKVLLSLVLLLNATTVFAHEAPKTDNDKQRYIDNYLKIYEIETRLISNFPALRFTIKNTGQEIIRRLEVVVYFLDKEGNPFYEKKFTPVQPVSFSYMKLLKPNYTFRLPTTQIWTASEVSPGEWSQKVEIAISDIDFKE